MQTDYAGQADLNATYRLFAESSMVKVVPDIPLAEGPYRKTIEIAVAGGEIEGGQIVIVPLTRELLGVEYCDFNWSTPIVRMKLRQYLRISNGWWPGRLGAALYPPARGRWQQVARGPGNL